jgi:isopentenyl diphosphate isomerase/L-lactate dehydrogenase-like FMN-dependent dehydrogenase
MVDHSLSAIEVLAEVVEVLPDHIDVAVDSGFTRGAEVCAALALGAKAVGVGRLQCWGLGVGGVAGLSRVLEILRDEITRTMANIGCREVSELTPDRVRWSTPAPPSELG